MIRILRIARLTDRQVLRLLDDFHQAYGSQVGHCQVQVLGVATQYPSGSLDSLKADKDIGAISSFDLNVGQPSISIRFRRGIGGSSKSMDSDQRKASPYLDEIGIEATHQNNQHPQPEHMIDVQRLVQKHVNLPADEGVVGPASEAVDLLKQQFAQLNEQLLEINTNSLKRREELEDEFAEKRRLLEEEQSRLADQLKDQGEKLSVEHDTRLEELRAREKQLDDRDHIHARRELRTHITDAIAEQLAGDLIPRKATMLGWSVFGLLLLGAFGLGGLSAWSLYEFGQITYLASLTAATNEVIGQREYAIALIEANGHWLVLARGFVSSAISIGFLLYAISWLKGLYHDEVRTRRELQRYSTDLSRASWAIETIMEAKSTGDVVIPDAVMVGVTRNLFETPGTGKANQEASANALAELLRTSGSVKFGPEGAEFHLSGRGANRLAEKIDH